MNNKEKGILLECLADIHRGMVAVHRKVDPRYVAPTYRIPDNTKSADAGAFAILIDMIQRDLEALSDKVSEVFSP